MTGYKMADISRDLARAFVGIAILTPAAIIADVVTLCGAFTEREEPYTATSLKMVKLNLGNATTRVLEFFK